MDADAIFGGNDNRVNGDIIIVERGGDVYQADAAYTFTLQSDCPRAANIGNFEPVPFNRTQALAFIMLNTYRISQAKNTITLDKAVELSYLRLLALKYKLVSPDYNPAANHCDYNQCIALAGNNTSTADVLDDNEHGVPRAAKLGIQTSAARVLTQDCLTKLNTCFTNIVCLVAYMFRVRGHHYLPDMAARYAQLWGKCSTGRNVFANSWEDITTVGLHAIMPTILDQFWLYSARNDRCDVILRLRVNSAAAGTALIPVLDQGLKDVITVFPAIRKLMPDEIKYIEDTEKHLVANRWDHSINARLYNANTDRIDEKRTGAAGALIRAAVTQLAPGTDLENSRALARAAKFAPITGAALGLALRNYVKSDSFMALQVNQ